MMANSSNNNNSNSITIKECQCSKINNSSWCSINNPHHMDKALINNLIININRIHNSSLLHNTLKIISLISISNLPLSNNLNNNSSSNTKAFRINSSINSRNNYSPNSIRISFPQICLNSNWKLILTIQVIQTLPLQIIIFLLLPSINPWLGSNHPSSKMSLPLWDKWATILSSNFIHHLISRTSNGWLPLNNNSSSNYLNK